MEFPSCTECQPFSFAHNINLRRTNCICVSQLLRHEYCQIHSNIICINNFLLCKTSFKNKMYQNVQIETLFLRCYRKGKIGLKKKSETPISYEKRYLASNQTTNKQINTLLLSTTLMQSLDAIKIHKTYNNKKMVMLITNVI